ncbi:MAG: hypothetical protein P8N56_04220 [Schleiferiaceae bacterium]|nr:hypothetical protein [Schleiferiaceae bacterium]
MMSMLLSIIVGERSHAAAVHNLLEMDPVLNAVYAGLKIIMGAAYLWFMRNHWAEIVGLLAFSLLVRLFAEGTFTIALIGAMMGRRWVQRDGVGNN